MQQITLGRTGLSVGCLGFGALPIQRAGMDDALKILRKAYAGGVTFYDTARMYTDSEEKLGQALAGCRHNVVIATKTTAQNQDDFFRDLEQSLKNLKTDYIDLLQFHFARQMPVEDSPLYQAMLKARQQGKIRFIGLTAHGLPVARQAAQSGLYDVVQFPISLLSNERDLELIDLCAANNVGLLAMKALAGGVVRNIAAAYAFMNRFTNLLPLWGIAQMHELEEFLALAANPPAYNAAMEQAVATEKAALGDGFCRGCGYCEPCPAGIEMLNIARIALICSVCHGSFMPLKPGRPRCAWPIRVYTVGNAPPAAPMN